MYIVKKLRPFIGLLILPWLFACTDSNESDQAVEPAQIQAEELTVYKSPTCGCCQAWIDHVENTGLATHTIHPSEMDMVKDSLQIPRDTRSCHTAVSKQGYVFEGHIPARYIQRFLSNPIEGAIGLAVPAMPIGSPGMEMGDKFTPYEILLLKKDGGAEVFAVIENAAQQYGDEG